MLSAEWKRGRFRRELLIEPLGTPPANTTGSSYNMLPLSEAYRRACQVAPRGRSWHHLMLLIYLRYHVHTRPEHTDPFWNRQMAGKPDSWNHSDMLVLLAADDIVAPADPIVKYLQQHCPKANFHVKVRGEHGCWCLDNLETFLGVANDWINRL